MTYVCFDRYKEQAKVYVRVFTEDGYCTPKEAWKRFDRHFYGEAQYHPAPWMDIHCTINERAKHWERLTRHAKNGKVGYIRAGRDCDCTSYRYEGVMDLPSGAVQALKEEWDRLNWLDGPESISYRSPDAEIRRYRSRDCALEAYEDGHGHYVVDHGAIPLD